MMTADGIRRSQEALVGLLQRIAGDAGLSPYLAHKVAWEAYKACSDVMMSKEGTVTLLAELDRRIAKFVSV